MFPNALIMEMDYFFLTAQSQKLSSLESALSVYVYMPGEKTCIFDLEPKKEHPWSLTWKWGTSNTYRFLIAELSYKQYEIYLSKSDEFSI